MDLIGRAICNYERDYPVMVVVVVKKKLPTNSKAAQVHIMELLNLRIFLFALKVCIIEVLTRQSYSQIPIIQKRFIVFLT
ncbi:MAG: hypothetical protein EA341_06485 [Mongoliibacter sp.]|nr:MAG: hypothetical protein EA341_06485 [Mongoliibacter sp.]